jgi:ABC-2 type transport system permease protein
MSAFFAGFRAEALILLRERAVWLALLALAAATLFALHTGAARVAAHGEIVAAARGEEMTRIDGLKKSLDRLEKGETQEEPPPYRDPRNAAFMGGGPAARVAALTPQPLALIATGQSDLYPPVVKVTTGSKDGFLFADEIDNPAHLLAGATDLAFIVAYVYPLVILALGFNLLAGEREQGTLAMTLASARRPGAVLGAKFCARVAAPIGVTLVAVALGVTVFAGAGALHSADALRLAAIILVYGLFWAALAAAVDGLGRSSAFNALTLVCAWVALALLAPAAINSLAAFAHPAPSRIDMTLAARAAATDADKARDAALARYVEEHSGAKPAREGTLRRLATQEAAFARVEAVIAQHDAQLARQRALADRLSFLSPTLLAYGALADVAGTGEARYRGFLARIDGFHGAWRNFFLTRAQDGAAMTAADYDVLPRFDETRDAPADAFTAPLAGMALPALVLAGIAASGFRRARP